MSALAISTIAVAAIGLIKNTSNNVHDSAWVCACWFERWRRCLPQVFQGEASCVRFSGLHARWCDTFLIMCLGRLVFVTKVWFWCKLGSGHRMKQEVNTAGQHQVEL